MPEEHHGHREHPDYSGDDRTHKHGKREMPKGGHDHGDHSHMMADFKRRFWISLVLTVPVLALSPMIQHFLGIRDRMSFPGEAFVLLAFASAVFFYGGWPFLSGMVNDLRNRQPGMMTLIGVAILTAYIYSALVALGLPGESFFWEMATLIVIMLLGHWIEMRSVMGASGAMEQLVRLMPADAHLVRDDGSTSDVKITDLKKGDRVLIKPGEKIPVDGQIIEGRTTVNEAMLTGESKPVEKQQEDRVIAGSINGESAVTAEVQQTGDETYLSRVIEMVRSAQASRSKTQDLADRAAFFLTVAAITVAVVTIGAWLIAGRSFVFSLERSVTVMVIACPHALGLAIPLVVATSTSLAARQGLFIRSRGAFERSRNIDAVIFDKTGTLTTGSFGVRRIEALEGDEDEVLKLAAAVEASSEHPIAAGIVAAARQRGIDLPQARDFSAIPGKGAHANIDGLDVKVVSPGYLREHDIDYNAASLENLAKGGNTVVSVLRDDVLIGAIALADVVRPESKEAVRRLKDSGIQVMMITGDSQEVATAVAEELGLDDYFAQVLPDEKARKVNEVKQRGLSVAMVGDGINDAPALAAADVGIAIGAGTDIAIESADIVLVRSNPLDVTRIVRLSTATYRKMKQNLWWAAGYNIIAVPLAAGVLYWAGILLPPAVGAVVMSASTVIVAVNARLLKIPST